MNNAIQERFCIGTPFIWFFFVAVAGLPNVACYTPESNVPPPNILWITTEDISLDVFDSQGQRVIALASGRWEEGVHEVDWEGISSAGLPVASGIYLARIVSNESISTHTLVVAR